MRIAYIAHYSELYGANRSLMDLVLQARRTGDVEPFLFIPREGPIEDLFQRENIPYCIANFEPWVSERRYMGRIHHRIMQHRRYQRAARERWRNTRKALPVMHKQVHQWQAEMLHANSSVAAVAPLLQQRCERPLVWHIREMPEKHYDLHFDKGKSRYVRSLRKADRLIANSNAVEKDLQEYIGKRGHIEVIYNGILYEAQYRELRERRKQVPINDGPFTFAMVGLIHPNKKQIEAVGALKIVLQHYPDTKLVIAGGGRDKDLRKRIDELQLNPQIELTGYIESAFDVMFKCDAHLTCSRNEAMGRVTVEAMACGIPVIGHRSGGTPELIEDGVNGLLYDGGVEDLAERMMQLITDREKTRNMGSKGARQVSESFTIERYAQQVVNEYHKVLKKKVQV